MGIFKYQASCRRAAWAAIVLALAVSCSQTPTTPTPPPPPPVADAPSLSCPEEGVSRATVNASGTNVSFDTPPIKGGEGSVTVSCTPQSGATFPIGATEVTCTAIDALNRTGTCTFNVNVSKLAQLSKVRYLAFGDSITAGEITVPIGGSLIGATGLFHKQVVVPGSAYPAVLQRTLQGRYASQAGDIIVANYGLGGEKVINARDRFIAGLNTVRPDVVIIIDGANDIPAGENGAASSAANEVRIMADLAARRGISVFIGTPPPGKPGSRQINTFLLEDYAGRMRQVAAQQGATLIDFYVLMKPEVDRYIGVDGLHPNELGYTKMADIVFQAIQASLEIR
jgi:lysophospholipase L1-like esterase